MGMSGEAGEAVLVGEEVVPRRCAGVDDRRNVGEDAAGEVTFLEVKPDAFDRVQWRGIRRQGDEADVRRHFRRPVTCRPALSMTRTAWTFGGSEAENATRKRLIIAVSAWGRIRPKASSVPGWTAP